MRLTWEALEGVFSRSESEAEAGSAEVVVSVVHEPREPLPGWPRFAARLVASEAGGRYFEGFVPAHSGLARPAALEELVFAAR